MVAGQKMVDSQGNEVALFPMENLHVSQGEHQLYAVDFLGWNANGRVYNCPCYAPFSCRVVFTGNDHNMIVQSLKPVRFADGTLDYCTILVAHSETDVPLLGKVFNQGTLFYHTGNYGHSFGDHLHMEVAKGKVKWDNSGLHLQNPSHMQNVLAVNNTVISNSGNIDWIEYQGGITPSSGGHRKTTFKWEIYARKLRKRRLKRH